MMRSFANIQAFLAHLAAAPAEMHAAQRAGEEAAGAALVEHAKDMIGREQDAWPPLADSTVAHKTKMGWTGRVSATDPLFARGELRASISHTVDGSGVTLGSTDPIAPFQEFGTARIPARSFIGATMFKHGQKATETIAGYVVAALVGDPAPKAK